jgi:hypothetical protein
LPGIPPTSFMTIVDAPRVMPEAALAAALAVFPPRAGCPKTEAYIVREAMMIPVDFMAIENCVTGKKQTLIIEDKMHTRWTEMSDGL